MDHPVVLQVVTFAMPHDKLGEDVVAAIVLRGERPQPNGNFVRFCQIVWRRSKRREKYIPDRDSKRRDWQVATYWVSRRNWDWLRIA